MHIMIVVQREAELFEVVFALGASSGFASLLDGRKQKGDQDGDDRNND